MAGVTVGSRNTCYQAARYGLTRTGLSPVGLHQLLLAPSEILASSFAGWGAICPEAAEVARELLKRIGNGQHMPLMEFYLYPPKYISSAAIATLAPPPLGRPIGEADLYRASSPELSGGKQALNYVNTVQSADGRRPHPIGDPSV